MDQSQHDDQNYGRDENSSSKKIILGRISGVHGVNGWLKVFSFTDPMEAIVEYDPWYIRPEKRHTENDNTAAWKKVRIKAGKRHAKTVIAKLEHCNDRDTALAYIGYEIAIEQVQLEQDRGENEYYWHELIGLRVINRQGVELGVVDHMMETGANDVVVVTENGEDNNNRERLIPWAMHQTIIRVDLQQGVLEVDWDPDF
jgi:16S rRNA processing protein RimM